MIRLVGILAAVAVLYVSWHATPAGNRVRRAIRRDRRRMSTRKRWAVWALGFGRCRYCHRWVKPGRAWGSVRGLQVDHWQPWSRGGSDWLPNLRASCTRCNRSKGATPGPEYLRKLVDSA